MNVKKGRYSAYVPDLSFYQQAVKCQAACPVRTDARGYVTAISRGDYERAYLIARENNPFASTCGWVCGAPCEAACRRGTIDAPISIRALKRFVNDRYGVRLLGPQDAAEGIEWRAYTGPDGVVDLGNSSLQSSLTRLREEDSREEGPRRRVAVVGSGPAGLGCAHDLALLGYDVVIFEATEVPGGMLRLGVPEYRLPRPLIDLEIATILSIGPELRLNQALGRDFSLTDLRADFDAVFIAIGTYVSRQLNVEGEELDGVLRAVDFLLNVNLGGYSLDLGRKVMVIGGGNVAMDVARTAARLGYEDQPTPEAAGDVELALDVARAARRLGATEEVHCLIVEARHEMLADVIEIEEAEAEGVQFHNSFAPRRIVSATTATWSASRRWMCCAPSMTTDALTPRSLPAPSASGTAPASSSPSGRRAN
jgi:NADPH-dependent glutamate synthase beta subunit-like oxidoreductase